MEKILTDSEKIRRAEEIYARRRGMYVENEEEKIGDFNIYKLFFKLLVLLNIIVIVLCFQNKNYIFKDEFLNKFYVYAEVINDKVNLFMNYLKEDENKTNELQIENKVINETVENTSNSTLVEESVEKAEPEKEKTITEKIKESYSFIRPISGTVTSFFGDRQSKYQNVSGFHKGIDIGAISGTKIVASTEGTVIQVSSKGDYRKSPKNRKWRNNNFICTLQKNICKRRRRNTSRTRNSRSRKYAVIVQGRICILK